MTDIKVWVLTGDKMETAENIGYSSNLIQGNFTKFYVNEHSEEYLESKFKELSQYLAEHDTSKSPLTILVEGSCLDTILTQKQFKTKFLDVFKQANSVVICRATPKQKSLVVQWVRYGLKVLTLAIGDGANDVNMIQAANVGVGLFGKEGMRAVLASDYALPEFRHLWRLLFVHGRLSYLRNTEMIMYFFYKNNLFTIPQFYFAYLAAFSGQTLFDDWYITFYNALFTLLPLAIRAVLEQDINYQEWDYPNSELSRNNYRLMNLRSNVNLWRKRLMSKQKKELIENLSLKALIPKLYITGQANLIFTKWNFLMWCLEGNLHGLVLFLICIYSMDDKTIAINGETNDYWYFSISFFTAIVFVVNLKLAIHTQYWTMFHVLAIWVTSIGLFFGYMWLADSYSGFLLHLTAAMLFTTPHFYLTVFLSCAIVYAGGMVLMVLVKEFKVQIIDMLRSTRNFSSQELIKNIQMVIGSSK